MKRKCVKRDRGEEEGRRDKEGDWREIEEIKRERHTEEETEK